MIESMEVQVNCEKHGPSTCKVYKWAHDESYSNPVCSGCLDERIEREKRIEEEQERRDEIKRRLRDSGMGPRYLDASCCFENYSVSNPKQAAALKAARTFADNFSEFQQTGSNLLFVGKPGTGKTFLACAIAKQLIETSLHRVIYRNVYDLIGDIKSAWDKRSQSAEDSIIERFCSAGLLVLDEIGCQFGSETEKLLVFKVLNGRYEELRPTLLISNLDLAGMKQYLDARTIDRLTESGSMAVVFDWESYRQTGQAKRFTVKQ